MNYSLNRLYAALGISKQAVHKQLSGYMQRKEVENQLLILIQDIRKDHPTMGMRDMYYKIQPISMGRDTFESFCKKHKFWSKKPLNYRRTTDSSGVIRFENLLMNTTVNQIDQVWQSDITYFEVNGQFYYLTFILDAYSRRILGHHTSKEMHTVNTTLPALKNAVQNRNNKLKENIIFHSDGGGQYYAKVFIDYTVKLKMRNSMCEYAWENGKAERINGVIKNNYLIHRSIKNFEDLTKEVDRAVRLYNTEKPHKALERKSPITFEKEILLLQEQPRPQNRAVLIGKYFKELLKSVNPI